MEIEDTRGDKFGAMAIRTRLVGAQLALLATLLAIRRNAVYFIYSLFAPVIFKAMERHVLELKSSPPLIFNVLALIQPTEARETVAISEQQESASLCKSLDVQGLGMRNDLRVRVRTCEGARPRQRIQRAYHVDHCDRHLKGCHVE